MLDIFDSNSHEVAGNDNWGSVADPASVFAVSSGLVVTRIEVLLGVESASL